MITVGALAMTATYPGRTHGLGMVTEPLLVDYGWATPDGRVFFASLSFWATLIGALFCLPVGWAMDRFDRRLVMICNMALLGFTVVWMSSIHDWRWLAVALVLTRGFGQSALSVVSITLVARSFSAAKLPMAMAWYAILAAPFHLALIKGVGRASAIEGLSWRAVWSGVGWSVVLLSCTALLIRGDAHVSGTVQPRAKDGYSLFEALRTPAFWTIALTISLYGMIYSGVALFNEDIFRERGFDRQLYFNVLAEVTVVALVSKFAFGWLAKHVCLTRLLAACLLVSSFSLAGLTLANRTWHAYAYGVGLGIASGAVALLFFTSWGKLFGHRELGRIQGAAQMTTVFASAAGPLIFSASKRATTSYTSVFLLLGGVMFIMSLTALFTPTPHARQTPSTSEE